MANVSAPFGLRPIQSAMGAASNFEMIQANIAYNNTQAIYRGDPVMMLATGYIDQWDAGTAVSQLWGVFWGCSYLSSSQGKVVQNPVWPGADVASTAQSTIVANIIPCSGSASPLFIIQSDATGAAFADIGANADVTVANGSLITGWSGVVLNCTTPPTTTATLPFRIVGLYGGAPGAGGFMGVQPSSTNPYGGSATGAYNWVVVRANVTGAGATGI